MVADPTLMMELSPEEILPRIGQAYLAFNRFSTRTLQLSIGEAIRRPEVAEIFFRSGPRRVLDFLKVCLGYQIELGRFRLHRVRSSARAFIVRLIPQLAGNLLYPTLLEDDLTNEKHLKTVVSIFIEGLKLEAEPLP